MSSAALKLDRSRRSSMILKQSSSQGDVLVGLSGELMFCEGTTLPQSPEVRAKKKKGKEELLVDDVGTQDLATLSSLSEESILKELELRYMHNVIYTNVGDILIAVNPFATLDGLYSDEASRKYFHDVPLCSTPHVFQVAQSAYKTLLQCHKNQCCVISGESGAGKTETAKFLVEQLLAMCKGTGTLEQRIMQVNPLLEAFGNARTVINDNSSRFGKYIDIKFGFFGEVLGASLSDYLLEKSRVVRQNDGERNFHVFYYLFAGLSRDQRTELALGDIPEYHYVRGGHKGLTRDLAIDIDMTEMRERFDNLVLCLSDVGFTSEERENIFRLLATVLHLGNVEFVPTREDFAQLAPTAPIPLLSRLLGVHDEDLTFAFIATTNITRGESIRTNYSVDAAEDNRDAVAKALYGRLFGWIVQRANTLLAPRTRAYKEAKSHEGGVTEVGILDIFGFENFALNSFEQFCINVANEQLQFYFNQHIFAWEQALYAEEGLNLSQIRYTDNQDLLGMVLQKPLGMFALLDEESKFPKATPHSLVDKFTKTKEICKWTRFSTVDASSAAKQIVRLKGDEAKVMRGSDEAGPFFQISHYADNVIYDANGFLEKNRDTLSRTVVSLLKASDNDLVHDLFHQKLSRTGTLTADGSTRGSASRLDKAKDNTKLSVSAYFKNSLLDLMDKMLAAQPHFIRCIKPNNEKLASLFVPAAVLKQLRYTGVLETTRIRRDGFAVRLEFAEFIRRYKTIGLKGVDTPRVDDDANPPSNEELRVACRRIVKRAGLHGTEMGVSKIFLKYFHSDALTKQMEVQQARATALTKTVRAFLARCKLRHLREAKARAERERREREERERRERELQEQLRREREAAEKAAREAAEAKARAEKLLHEQELQRKETIRQQQVEAQRRAEEERKIAAAKAEEARLASERLQRLAAEQAEREERERREREAAEAERQRVADAEREQRRRENQAKFEAAQAAAQAANVGKRDSVFDTLTQRQAADAAAFAQEAGDPGAFNELLEDAEVSEEERQILAAKLAARQREEVLHKQQLAREHARHKLEESRMHMLELQRIAERQQREREEREAAARADEEAMASRMAELDFGSFGFAFGSPAPPLPPPPKADGRQSVRGAKGLPPIPASPAAAPPTLPPLPPSPSVGAAPPSPTSQHGTVGKGSKLPTPLITPHGSVHVMPRDTVAPRGRTTDTDTDVEPTPPRGAAPPVAAKPSRRPTADSVRKPEPPPVKPRPSVSSRPASADAAVAKTEPPASAPPSVPPPMAPPTGPPPSAPPAAVAPPLPPPPAAAAPPLPPAPRVSPTPPTATSTPAAAAATAAAEAPPLPPPPSPSPTPTSTTSATPVAAAAGGAAPAEGGPRRKLVRGANKQETPVLPEYAAALAAIAELDKYLDAIESADRVLAEQQRERELMSPEGATFGSVHRRDRSRKSSRQHVMTMADVDALGNLLLVGEQAPVASPAPASGTATPKTPGLTPEAHARFIDGVRGSQEALKAHGLPSPRPAIPIPRTDSTSAVRPPPLLRSGSTAGSVNINGVKLTPADLLKIDEVQRVAILNRVKDGEMTIEDALSQVVENKQQQQCVIS